MKQQTKKYLKTAGKIILTGFALYFVYQKIDIEQTKKILNETQYGYLFLATIFFGASKVVSALRLNRYFKSIWLNLSETYNLKLYVIGMFYNLFLPGGIGGDGYKVYLLNKEFKTTVKQLVAATLIDRISGLMALLIILLILSINLMPLPFLYGYDWLIYLGLLVGYPIYYLFNKLFFGSFVNSLISTSLYSLAVQGLQLISAYFILLSIGIPLKEHLAYQTMFLVSSIVAVLPFTIGGIGAREMTFILGHEHLGIDLNAAVAFSLIFFLITAITSLIGAFIKAK